MNKLTLIGRITKDAELKYTSGGKAVTQIGIAVDDGWGETKSTIWIRASLFGERAEKLTEYLTKGKQVYVEGRLSHENGNPRIWGEPARASFEIVVSELTLLGGKKQEEDMPF